MPHCGVDINDARCDTSIVTPCDEGGCMEKAKEMYQRKIRIPDDVKRAIVINGERQSRQFNTEVIHQLRKAYGLIGGRGAQE